MAGHFKHRLKNILIRFFFQKIENFIQLFQRSEQILAIVLLFAFFTKFFGALTTDKIVERSKIVRFLDWFRLIVETFLQQVF